MNKISIVAKREFLTRVKKKTFLLTTIGLPLLIFGVYALIFYFAANSSEDTKIAVVDEANIFNNKLTDKGKEIHFLSVKNTTKIELDSAVAKNTYDAYIYIPKSFSLNNLKDSIHIVSQKSIGIITQSKIEDKLSNILEENKLTTSLNLTKQQLDSLKQTNSISFVNLKSGENTNVKSVASTLVGYGFGILIYVVLLIYGTMVMRGVAEEKTNRIAEVIVSSVKPFQLMMGKIIGIGSVGLLQFFIWIMLTFVLQFLLPLFMHVPQNPAMAGAADTMQQTNVMAKFGEIISQINMPLILCCFLFYFFAGYFMYASLFAAIGSLVSDDPNDAQSLTLPVTMPIIFGFIIMMQAVNTPTSSISVFGSLFPLTSPIVMMARVAHGVPEGVSVFQLILSMVLLILGFIGTTWIAAKIYRTGILMYGKKVTFKELGKLIFRKG
ncbi:MAG: ABC transporter permease [Bacteroidetes bacterium]|nr:ABC transporter permease [Bacteroidota bacterium]